MYIHVCKFLRVSVLPRSNTDMYIHMCKFGGLGTVHFFVSFCFVLLLSFRAGFLADLHLSSSKLSCLSTKGRAFLCLIIDEFKGYITTFYFVGGELGTAQCRTGRTTHESLFSTCGSQGLNSSMCSHHQVWPITCLYPWNHLTFPACDYLFVPGFWALESRALLTNISQSPVLLDFELIPSFFGSCSVLGRVLKIVRHHW